LNEDERTHQRRLQVEAAHWKARDLYVGETAGALEWLNYEWGSNYGLDADWVPDNDPTPSLTSVSEVIKALRRVELQHPTAVVRDLARDLREGISGHYGSIRTIWHRDAEDYEQVAGVTPASDTFDKWAKKGEALLVAMHEPPP
jgi:hypothetical protein